jgi:PAS domain S-box-containing protein
MHRPQSTAESAPPVQIWLQTHGRQALVLAVSYFIFGHASFLVRVDDVLVTPVLFAPEGIALAMALRFGMSVWPGVFAGQLALALSRGLAPLPSLSISAINSVEAVLAVLLFRALKLDAGLPRARDLTGLLLLIFFVLQPFSATLGNATLWAGGIVDRPELVSSWLNWWIGNSFGQMLVAPLLLALFAGARGKWQTAGDFLVPVLVILPSFWAADYLLRWTGVSSLVVIFAPILVLLAIYRGLAAVCMGALLIALGALYATSHAFGPFVSEGRADIPGLNLFIIGLALSGQYLAIFLSQTRAQQKLEDQLRDAREQLQRTAFELTENIPVGTYVLEFDTRGEPHFTFLSERYLAMTNLKREEVMANHALALQPMSPPDRSEIERLNREVFASKKPFFWEGEITVRGEKRYVTLESVPRTRPGGGTIWEGVMTDITERKAAASRETQNEVRHRKELETKLKTSLAAAAVAHEINQPLSAILLRSKVALEEGRNEREALSVVADEAQRVVTTIEKMKTLMRSVQTEHRAIDLRAVVRSALLYNKTMLSRHDITVRESGLDKAHNIMGDDAQLQLALTNILRNAAEAIDESATGRREISVDLAGNDDEVSLTIGDSGPGWSGAELAETPLTTTKKGGTGIGLYVARTAMENHHGEIVFGSSPLGGAEVRLKFPRITEKA